MARRQIKVDDLNFSNLIDDMDDPDIRDEAIRKALVLIEDAIAHGDGISLEGAQVARPIIRRILMHVARTGLR